MTVTAWKELERRDLVIPLGAFITTQPWLLYPHEDIDEWEGYVRDAKHVEFGMVVPIAAYAAGAPFPFYRNLLGGFIRGMVHGRDLHVAALRFQGDHTDYSWPALLDALRQSSGVLRARLGWNGGERVGMLTVHDGVVQYVEH